MRIIFKISFIVIVLACTCVPASGSEQEPRTDATVAIENADFFSGIEVVQDTAAVDKKSKEKKKDKKEDINLDDVFFYNLGINILAVLILILLVYYPGNRNKEQIFTFVLFNLIIFMITYVLNEVKISMGAAFGLFAVFSMLRYRTLSITMKDMTYLFIFIALGLINAVHLKYGVMAFINSFVIVVTFILDSNLIFHRESSKTIQYDNIELIRPENHSLLLKDLRERTGLNVSRFRIERVNFLRDSVRITVFYREVPGGLYAPKNGSNQ